MNRPCPAHFDPLHAMDVLTIAMNYLGGLNMALSDLEQGIEKEALSLLASCVRDQLEVVMEELTEANDEALKKRGVIR